MEEIIVDPPCGVAMGRWQPEGLTEGLLGRATMKRTVGQARRLRREMSLPEVLLWQILRTQPEGVKFRRQHPIGAYVLDFYCAEAKLAIEIDGIAHDMGERPAADKARDLWLKQKGVEVIRLAAKDVLADAGAVAERLLGLVLSRR